MKNIWLFLLIAACCSGCSSIRTTIVDRTENDCLVVNPNCPLKGIPVSLRVPTHLELRVIEVTHWQKKIVPGESPTLAPLSSCRPTRLVEHNVCETEKIFLVDPVKPLAGSNKFGFTFKSNADDGEAAAGKGYLDEVNYTIDDESIKKSGELAANTIGLLNALQVSASQAQATTSQLVTTERAVAFARFDLDSPSFEGDVASFLDTHINCATQSSCPIVCPVERCPQ